MQGRGLWRHPSSCACGSESSDQARERKRVVWGSLGEWLVVVGMADGESSGGGGHGGRHDGEIDRGTSG